ncbi:DNA-binding helix-turn-helix protein [Leptospira weilii serovar Topaz str. LT2116]|uniref:DNA-binding helix-turn-helix protein n=1 Tax=Leptospira weilii serovar Topaz str. LT2116 TaxID=1088540 RepID=M3EMA8_9LEPT|nr:DNA-binding helix-turn-helix protein [Leptospira weilii serovar Topaz str. LT2116]
MLYEPEEVAILLGVEPRTVANYRLEGRLHAKGVNKRKLLYEGADVLKLLTPIKEHHYDA